MTWELEFPWPQAMGHELGQSLFVGLQPPHLCWVTRDRTVTSLNSDLSLFLQQCGWQWLVFVGTHQKSSGLTSSLELYQEGLGVFNRVLPM